MKARAVDIINSHTDLDELMQGLRGPLMLLSPKEMFEMGQFYEWSRQVVENTKLNRESLVEVPEELYWVIGETKGW